MTCEYNSGSCEDCKRKYCPDIVKDIKIKLLELKKEVAIAEDELIILKCRLSSYKTKYKNLDEEW